MARWIRAESSAHEDIRINLVIRATKDPEIHRALNRLEHRGGPAQALRFILEQAHASGQLDQIVEAIKAGKEAAHVTPVTKSVVPPAPVASDAAVERMKGLNRF